MKIRKGSLVRWSDRWLDNKQGEYLQQASLFMQEFTQMVTTIKISENMNSFGQMSSPIRQAQHIR